MTDQAPFQKTLQPAPEDDTRSAHAVPSTLVNRFHLTAGDAIMRITFGEQIPPNQGVAYHRAVTLPREDAILLGRMILEMYQVEHHPAMAH